MTQTSHRRIHPNHFNKPVKPDGSKCCAMCGEYRVPRDLIGVWSDNLKNYVWVCRKTWFNANGRCSESG